MARVGTQTCLARAKYGQLARKERSRCSNGAPPQRDRGRGQFAGRLEKISVLQAPHCSLLPLKSPRGRSTRQGSGKKDKNNCGQREFPRFSCNFFGPPSPVKLAVYFSSARQLRLRARSRSLKYQLDTNYQLDAQASGSPPAGHHTRSPSAVATGGSPRPRL